MAVVEPNPPESRVELEVHRIQALIERRQFLLALTAAEAMLVEVPENRDVLYLVAVSQRYLGRITDALRTLARFEGIHPDFGRLYQERGHCCRAAGETAESIGRNTTFSINRVLICLTSDTLSVLSAFASSRVNNTRYSGTSLSRIMGSWSNNPGEL